MEKKYQCECCKQMKRESEFYKDNRRRFGLKLDRCKACTKERYLQQKEKKIKYQIQWNYEHPDKLREYMDRYLSKKAIYC